MSPVRPSLGVDLDGLAFPTPVLAASGCFGSGKEMAEAIDLTGIGGVVTKSVTLEPRHGLPVPRMAETDFSCVPCWEASVVRGYRRRNCETASFALDVPYTLVACAF